MNDPRFGGGFGRPFVCDYALDVFSWPAIDGVFAFIPSTPLRSLIALGAANDTRIVAFHLTPARLRSYRASVIFRFGTFNAGEGRKGFCPMWLGHELGFLIAKSRFECRGRERERR